MRGLTRLELMRLGAALGVAGGPAAAFGQAHAGTGDARLHVWLLAALLAALLGALTLPLFYLRREASDEPALAPVEGEAPAVAAVEGDGPGAGFGALFGLAVGLVAGCFAAFPMGAVMGGVGGALGAAVGGLMWRRLAGRRFGLVATGLVAAGVGLFGPWLWTR